MIEPLGFRLDEKSLRRAGLDYWDQVTVRQWPSFDAFRDWFSGTYPGARLFFLTTKGKKNYWDEEFSDGDGLVFGRETKGLPDSLLKSHPENCLTIPMDKEARSLNLATSAGIVLYEAIRQQY